jgi:hypothetical protein
MGSLSSMCIVLFFGHPVLMQLFCASMFVDTSVGAGVLAFGRSLCLYKLQDLFLCLP